MTFATLALALFLGCFPQETDAASIQEPMLPVDEPAPVVTLEERSLATLAALRDSRASKLAELQVLRDNFDPEVSSEERLAQLEQVRKLQSEIARIEYDFESVATGIDVRAFDLGLESDFNLMEQVEGLLEPMLSELHAVTEAPREMERLRGVLEYAKDHETLAQAAVEQLDRLLELAENAENAEAIPEELREHLEGSRDNWQKRLRELDNQRTVAQFQLDQREARKESILDSAGNVLGKFFRTRGLNLLLSAAAFLAILLGLRGAHSGARWLLRKRSNRERKFYARLIDVVYFGFSGVAALGGALLVLYSVGDWSLLGVAILMLFGIAWASKNAIPVFFEQLRLLLNLASVREGERIIMDGLPWRVARLSLHAQMVNPDLAGGQMRVPLRDLTGLRSRASAAGERWFPTKRKDWILLDGERLGHVVFQSPEIVRVELQGGSIVTFPTTEFLEARVENLSTGFRIDQRFGIDYAHQAICTDEVPTKMRAFLIEALHARFEPAHLRELKVEFLEAGASSLDYAVLADFEPGAAPQYMEIKRALQSLLVDLCNREGWNIPFTQITLHTAAGAVD